VVVRTPLDRGLHLLGVKKAGAGVAFKYSAKHAVYISWLKPIALQTKLTELQKSRLAWGIMFARAELIVTPRMRTSTKA
jgi:hypothetical protein